MEYRHTQICWMIIVVFGAAVGLFAWIDASTPAPSWLLGPMGVAFAVIGVLFCSLTVTVDETEVVLRFSPGPIRHRVPLEDIASAEALRLPWWAIAFGLRMSLNAERQLWLVSG